MTPAWKAFIEGTAYAKATLKGFYDQTSDAALVANVRDGGSVLTYGPAGLAAIGDPARLLLVHEVAIAESSPVAARSSPPRGSRRRRGGLRLVPAPAERRHRHDNRRHPQRRGGHRGGLAGAPST